MQPRGPLLLPGRAAPRHLRPQQARGEEGEQVPQVPGVMWNPLSWVKAAAIMAIALANGGGKPPDWQDFVGIITLLIINSTISFIEENNAGNAAAALMAQLAPKAKVLRNRKWNEESAILVPGDIISVKLGDIIPADARLLDIRRCVTRCARPFQQLPLNAHPPQVAGPERKSIHVV